MLTKKLVKALRRLEDTTKYKIGRFKKRYKFLNKSDIIKAVVFILFVFLFSGGATTLFSGASGIVARDSLTTQTPTEFFIYTFIHIGYAVGIYLIYSGIRKSRIDVAFISLGLIILFSLLFIEWYIVSIVKGVVI